MSSGASRGRNEKSTIVICGSTTRTSTQNVTPSTMNSAMPGPFVAMNRRAVAAMPMAARPYSSSAIAPAGSATACSGS